MSSFSFTDEMAIDTLIFWVESTDGSISFAEKETVKRVLDTMNYDLSTYHKTMGQISALSTENMLLMIEEAITYVRSNFSDDGKKLTYSLLDTVAHSDGSLSKGQKEKLHRLKGEFAV